MAESRIVDLFAGAGGWEEGLRALGHAAVGIETDPYACQTARAAGHERAELDVAATDPTAFAPVWGLIASPPCQAYSLAGKGLGRLDRPHVHACAHDLAAGHDTRAERRTLCRDPGSLLTVEPLRWALALRPRWIALEQVPPVLELWNLFAQLLGVHRYHAATGVLSAERYGVAQTRKRAFLIASLDGPVALPAPTHRPYDPRHPDLVRDEDRDRLPWVSMAEALGWSPELISYTNAHTGGGRRPRGLIRGLDRPARTLDTSAGAWTIEPPQPRHRGDCPPTPGGFDRRRGGAPIRRVGAPAPTLVAEGLARGTAVWVHRRPATTVLTDPRVQPPGHKHCAADPLGRYASRAGRDAVRVTTAQAAILQGFRPDYPWQGARSRQFRQIGNAVCPPVARKVLAEAMRPSQPRRGRPR